MSNLWASATWTNDHFGISGYGSNMLTLRGMKVCESQPFWREQKGTRVLIHSNETHHTDSQYLLINSFICRSSPFLSFFWSSVPSLSGITGDCGMQDTLDSVCESNALQKNVLANASNSKCTTKIPVQNMCSTMWWNQRVKKNNCMGLLTRLQVRLMRGSTHPSLGMRCWKCFCIMPFTRWIERFEVVIRSEFMWHKRSLKLF